MAHYLLVSQILCKPVFGISFAHIVSKLVFNLQNHQARN
jgi:hypothetical protein